MQGAFFQGGWDPLREVQTLPLRGGPRHLRGEGVAVLYLPQYELHETSRPAEGDPRGDRRRMRFRDRKRNPFDPDHPPGGPSEGEEGDPAGDPDGPVRLPEQRYRLGAAPQDDPGWDGRTSIANGDTITIVAGLYMF